MSHPAGDPYQLLKLASEGNAEGIAYVLEEFGLQVNQMKHLGESKYGPLGLSLEQFASGLARILLLQKKARMRHRPNRTPPSPADLIEDVKWADVAFAESLARGSNSSWIAFQEMLDEIMRKLRSQALGTRSVAVAEEIRNEVLSVFYLGGKILTYRGSAPIYGWARQILSNLIKRTHRRRAINQDLNAPDNQLDNEELVMSFEDSRVEDPAMRLDQVIWTQALAKAIPEALAELDRDERKILSLLATGSTTQIALAKEMGVNTFRMNRWYQDIRIRFRKAISRSLQMNLQVDEAELDALLAYLTQLWAAKAPQSEENGPDEENPA